MDAEAPELFVFRCLVILSDNPASRFRNYLGWQPGSSGSLHLSSEYKYLFIGRDRGFQGDDAGNSGKK